MNATESENAIQEWAADRMGFPRQKGGGGCMQHSFKSIRENGKVTFFKYIRLDRTKQVSK